MPTLLRETVWVIPEDLPGPARRALADVARDWRRRFATEPRLVRFDQAPPDASLVVAVGAEALTCLGVGAQQFDPDAWRVHLHSPAAGPRVIGIDGGGPRGLLYALYGFSEHLLGVDPFWFWTDQRASQTDEVEVPADLDVYRAAPSFRWRGWFCNDEDLLTEWAPSLQPSHGIALGVWDRIYETLLRTGGNFVIPGTFVFPDEPQIRLAADRGLAVGQHHIEVLGLNTYRWPNDVPYSYATHPEILRAAWREGVASYGDLEVVWSVGYRGRHDRPFWYDDDSTGRDAASRGALISRAIADQVGIIRASRPDDTIVLNLWMEGSELAAAGHLTLPADVIVVWPDDGHGEVLDAGTISAGQGIYYHTAMHDRVASQLTEMVEVERIAAEFRRAQAAHAVQHVLINVSDVRPVVLTTQAAMDLAWDPAVDVSDYYERWARRQVGAEEAAELARLWRGYFEAPWHYRTGHPDRLEDNAYQTFARGLTIAAANGRLGEPYVYTTFAAHFPRPFQLLGDHTAASLAAAFAEGTRQAQPRIDRLLDSAMALTGRVSDDRRGFLQGHLVTQLAVHSTSNRELHAVAQAVLALRGSDHEAATDWLEEARIAAVDLLKVLRAGETIGWNEWYRGDEFVNVPASLALIERLLTVLRSGNWPSQDPAFREPRDQYIRIKRYQEGRSSAPSSHLPTGDTD